MGPFRVVVVAPILHLFPGIRKAEEPVRVETFRPEATVEYLDIGIVRRLSGPGEVQGNTALIRPQIQIARRELGALIDTNCCRESHHPAGP